MAIDFFCGCGGTSAGLRAAGIKIAAGIDFDSGAAETFRLNFPDAEFFESDIRKLEVEALDDVAGREKTGLVISACAPCQPFSSLRRDGSTQRDNDRTLLLRLLPFVERLKPEVVLVENVPGMQKVPGASTWRRFISSLKRTGYYVSWDIVDCRSYGVPQRRRRLVLLASRLAPLEIPAPTHGRNPGQQPFSKVRDWIGDLPPIGAGETHPGDENHRAGRLGELNLQRIRSLREGGSRADWPDHLWLDCHRGFDGHEDVYGRMSFDRCAPVLTTKCTDLTNGRFGHPVQDRAISVREAASLQTFPREFRFAGGLKSTTRQVGNAVPVLLAEKLGETIVSHIEAHV